MNRLVYKMLKKKRGKKLKVWKMLNIISLSLQWRLQTACFVQPTVQNSSFTIINVTEKQQILTFKG